jgi:hypothetical protein
MDSSAMPNAELAGLYCEVELAKVAVKSMMEK